MSKKTTIPTKIQIFSSVMIIALTLLFLAGCKPEPIKPDNSTLFNQTVNEQIEEISNNPIFSEFYFNYTAREDAKYEIARDDLFLLSKGNFTSDEISFLGVKLGDSYQTILEKIGIPDVMFVSADQSYKNIEYKRKIGIPGNASAITFHVENDTVTIITLRLPFGKYLQGNTSFGLKRDVSYSVIGIPDYQDFAFDVYRVHHFVSKGMDIYFKTDHAEIMSFKMPREFKGVKYVKKLQDMGYGITINVTEAVLIE